MQSSLIIAIFLLSVSTGVNSFSKCAIHRPSLISFHTKPTLHRPIQNHLQSRSTNDDLDSNHESNPSIENHLQEKQTLNPNRRSILTSVARSIVLAGASAAAVPLSANAAVGTLPEFSETNAILQGLTVNVADLAQESAMINFLKDSFDFEVLRQRKVGDISDTWLGFGPEQPSVPSDFEFPVSSFKMYGGHASIHIRYDSKSTVLLYDGKSDQPPGDNIAFLQVGVPTYRISQMVQNGGNVLDAYGFVNVISPAGLPIRGIVGISPDPIMFVAINCQDAQKSREFYEKLGMSEVPYPYARPSKGLSQFEPIQPPKSVYLSNSPDSMGVLLLQTKKRKTPSSNPALKSLNIVYTPSETVSPDVPMEDIQANDPSGVAIAFSPVDRFVELERLTK